MGLLFALGGLAVWYIGGRDVLFGSMTLGSLMAFLAYPGDVLHAADLDRRIDHLVRQFLQHQPPDLRLAGRAQRKRRTPGRPSRSAGSAGTSSSSTCRSATTRAGPCSKTSALRSSRARWWAWWAEAARASRRWSASSAGLYEVRCRADPHRRRRRAAGESAGNCAGRSAWCPRSRSCSADRSPTNITYGNAAGHAGADPAGRQAGRRPRLHHADAVGLSRRNWAKAAPASPAASGSGSRSPGPCCSIRPS